MELRINRVRINRSRPVIIYIVLSVFIAISFVPFLRCSLSDRHLAGNRSTLRGRWRSVSTRHIMTATNEVWGKVIFSEQCVKNSVHGGEGCLLRGGGGVCSHGGSAPRGVGLLGGGCLLQGVCVVETPSVTATVVGGTHPTGMHSCCPWSVKNNIKTET